MPSNAFVSSRWSRWARVSVAAAAGICAVGSAWAATAPKKKTTPPAKKYVSSAGKPAPKPVPKTVAVAKKPAPKPVASKKPRVAPVPSKTRLVAHDAVFRNVSDGAQLPVENAAALIPFFEQLYRHQRGEMNGPVRVLQYGDSHTAADEWTGELRQRFQEKFGQGGSGYSLAGRPYAGYRRLDLRSGSTRGWHSDGLVGRAGDGVYGLGGVSMTASAPRESVYLEAEASAFELFYYQQPGGGMLQIYDNGLPIEQVSTDGAASPGYFKMDASPGPHRVEVETLDRSPVRLFGWVSENPTGITYEPLGINGASASIMLDWNQDVLLANLAHRDPALIVLAYGTNEAGRKDLTLESYRDMFTHLISQLRAAAPAATILVVGPPDREIRTRKGWVAMDALDHIVEAQRQAALALGCPFWDQRAKMGGKGAMRSWVSAGMAQKDHVHFTAPGYRLLGDAIFRDLLSQYELFLKAREQIAQVARD